jgi:hypothetical protein
MSLGRADPLCPAQDLDFSCQLETLMVDAAGPAAAGKPTLARGNTVA